MTVCTGCGGPIEPGMPTTDIELTRWHLRCAHAAKAELFAKSYRYFGRRPWFWGKRVLRKSDLRAWLLKYAGGGD